jgi:hypothetical protein
MLPLTGGRDSPLESSRSPKPGVRLFVHPYAWKDDSAADFARSVGVLAGPRSRDDVSLSPASLRATPNDAGRRRAKRGSTAMESPNGSLGWNVKH